MKMDKCPTPALLDLLGLMDPESEMAQAVRNELQRRKTAGEQATAPERGPPPQVQAAFCALNHLALLRARETMDPGAKLNTHERRVWLIALEVIANYLNGEVQFEAGTPINLVVEPDDG